MITKLSGPHTVAPSCVGDWVYIDKYGRAITWLISHDGTMKCFASDDPSDIREYQWWTRNGNLIIRNPISTIDHAYYIASFALDGRAFDDQRMELRISESNSKSLTLTPADGPVLVLTKRSRLR